MEHAADRVFSTQAEASIRYISVFGTRTRFVVLILVLFSLTSIWSNILTFNFALICMAPTPHDNSSLPTSSNSTTEVSYSFTHDQNTLAMTTVALAALIGNFPVVVMVNRLGMRTVFASLGIMSAVSTLLIPTAIRMGFTYFLALRVLQGLAFATSFPVIGAFCSRWTYYKQNGLFVSALVANLQLAPAFTNPASGALCASFKWPSIFYAHGAISLFLFISYALFFRNNPNKHPFVGDVEKNKIGVGKANIDKKTLKKVPYGDILSTPAIWATWIASIGNFSCANIMFLFAPTYMSKVLGYSVHRTGLAAAIPPLAQFTMKFICGILSDRIKFLSEVNKFRFFNTISFVGSAGFLCTLAFMDPAHATLCTLLFGGATGILGAATGGFFKAAPVLSKQYSHFVTGNLSLGVTITMLVVPLYVNVLTEHNTQEEWKWVFLITACILLVCNFVFVVCVKGEPCSWTEEAYAKRNSLKSISDIRFNGVNVEHLNDLSKGHF